MSEQIPANGYWSMEIFYELHQVIDRTEKKTVRITEQRETRAHRFKNLDEERMLKIRHAVFSVGLMIQIAPGEFVVIPPRQISDIYITKQSKKFE